MTEYDTSANICISKVSGQSSITMAPFSLEHCNIEVERNYGLWHMISLCVSKLETRGSELVDLKMIIQGLKQSNDLLVKGTRKDVDEKCSQRDVLITTFVQILNEKKQAVAKAVSKIETSH